MSKRPAKTVLEVVLARAGYRRGMRIGRFIVCWGIWLDSTRDDDVHRNIENYAAWWEMKVRQAYLDQAAFREVLGEEDPARIWELAREHVNVDVSSRRAARAQVLGNVARLGGVDWVPA